MEYGMTEKLPTPTARTPRRTHGLNVHLADHDDLHNTRVRALLRIADQFGCKSISDLMKKLADGKLIVAVPRQK